MHFAIPHSFAGSESAFALNGADLPPGPGLIRFIAVLFEAILSTRCRHAVPIPHHSPAASLFRSQMPGSVTHHSQGKGKDRGDE
jgi:hypothetical protein